MFVYTSDETKVGQKLLEKMGWRKGIALGLKEDGRKEHVKVSTKSDRKGLFICPTDHQHTIVLAIPQVNVG